MPADLIMFPRGLDRDIPRQSDPVVIEGPVVRVLSQLELIRRRWRKADDAKAVAELPTAALDEKARQKLRAILHDSVLDIGRERTLRALEAIRLELAEGKLG